MDALSFSQRRVKPLPTYYQGNDARELAYQCFVDWEEAHHYGEVHEFLAQVRAINHAAHWLQVDITVHAKLKHTLQTLNKNILSKSKMLKMCQHPSRKGSAFVLAAEQLVNAAIPRIAQLRAQLATIKATIGAVKAERYRSPMVETAYRILSSGHDFLGPNSNSSSSSSSSSNMAALQPVIWAVEQLTCLIFLALEAEIETYKTNMSRLSRDLAPKLAAKLAAANEKQQQQQCDHDHSSSMIKKDTTSNDFLENLQYQQSLLERLFGTNVTGPEDAQAQQHSKDSSVGDSDTGTGSKAGSEQGEQQNYLGQIVRYWSRWDLDGYAQRDFRMVWEFVAGRKCVVWSR